MVWSLTCSNLTVGEKLWFCYIWLNLTIKDGYLVAIVLIGNEDMSEKGRKAEQNIEGSDCRVIVPE